MDQSAGCSKRSVAHKRPNLCDAELIMVKNVYKGIRSRNSNTSVSEAVDMCSSLTKVSVATVYRAIKNSVEVNPKKKKWKHEGGRK
jgi:hypothetical protein